MRTRSGWTWCAVAFLFLLPCGCGGGGGNPAEQLVWDIPPLPSSLEAGGFNNQTPPPEWLQPEFVMRTEVERIQLTRTEEAALEATALALARAFLTLNVIDPLNDMQTRHLVQDEFGSFHVKLQQTHSGVPVLGGGMISHIYADLPNDVTENVIRGISMSTTPRIAEADALATAMAAYGTSPLTLTTTQRLAIQPTLDLIRIAAGSGVDNTDDFELQLQSADLVWEIVIGPEVPDDATFLRALLDSTTPNAEPDDEALRVTRAANATHGGNPAPDVTTNGPLAFLSEPSVRYLVDATTGDVRSSQVLIDEGGDLLDDLEPKKGTGYSYFSGKVDLDTSYYPAMDFHVLIDCARPTDGVGNVTYDGLGKETYTANNMAFLADGNNSWGDGSIQGTELQSNLTTTRRQTPAVDVAYGIQLTWDFLKNVASRHGPDGDGTSVKACVHWGQGYTDARYDRNSKFIVFGDSDSTIKPGNYGIATVGHELGHRFWHREGIESKPGESSALNEGHGDIQGSLVLFYRDTANGTGTRIRRTSNFGNWTTRMRDPDGYSEPDGEGGDVFGFAYWDSTLKDNPEHVGGLPFGRAMIYLAEGAPMDPADTLHTIEYPNGLGGVGLHRAARIWKTAIESYLVGAPSYLHMRTAFFQAAEYLYPNSVMQRNAVRRAFAAIRVGSRKNDLDDPEILYAQLYDVNLKDMTARVHAAVTDDTGIRQMRVTGHENNGYYNTPDYLNGYVNISRVPLGSHSFTIEIEDSHGRKTSVFRSVTKARDRNLIQNGDFEDPIDGTDWVSTSGEDRSFSSDQRAFIGRYLTMSDTETVYQDVTIPAQAEDVCLVYRVLVRDSVTSVDGLDVRVLNTNGEVLRVLESYSAGTSRNGRTWLNKGYLREEFDVSEFAGQTIRIAFSNSTFAGQFRFNIDQVMLTYTEDVFVDVPKATLSEWENFVAFQLPTIQGIQPNEIQRVVYYVNNQAVSSSTNPAHDWYAGEWLDELGPGPWWVGAIVRGFANQVLAQTSGVWFVPLNKPELLTNGGFESGGWNPGFSDIAPSVEVVPNDINQTVSWDGTRALRMGREGSAGTSQIGQVVQVPISLKSMDFSCRLRVISAEPGADDKLWLELWDATKFELIEKIQITDSSRDDITTPGNTHLYSRYHRRDISLKPGKYSGKSLLVLLRMEEDNGNATSFWIDNVSLRYAQFGFQFN